MAWQGQERLGTRQAQHAFSMLTPKASTKTGASQPGRAADRGHLLLLWSVEPGFSSVPVKPWDMPSWPKEIRSSENMLPI